LATQRWGSASIFHQPPGFLAHEFEFKVTAEKTGEEHPEIKRETAKKKRGEILSEKFFLQLRLQIGLIKNCSRSYVSHSQKSGGKWEPEKQTKKNRTLLKRCDKLFQLNLILIFSPTLIFCCHFFPSCALNA